MKKALIALALLCILVLSGCSGIFDGSYTSVTPHSVPSEAPAAQEKYGAKDRDELYAVVEKLVHNGLTGAVIDVATYDQLSVEGDAQWVVGAVLKNDPIAAYAVEEICFDKQIIETKARLSVVVNYRDDRSQVRSTVVKSGWCCIFTIIAGRISRKSWRIMPMLCRKWWWNALKYRLGFTRSKG